MLSKLTPSNQSISLNISDIVSFLISIFHAKQALKKAKIFHLPTNLILSSDTRLLVYRTQISQSKFRFSSTTILQKISFSV